MYVLIVDTRFVRDEEEEREGMRTVRLRNFFGRWLYVEEEQLEHDWDKEPEHEIEERGEEQKGERNNVGNSDKN